MAFQCKSPTKVFVILVFYSNCLTFDWSRFLCGTSLCQFQVIDVDSSDRFVNPLPSTLVELIALGAPWLASNYSIGITTNNGSIAILMNWWRGTMLATLVWASQCSPPVRWMIVWRWWWPHHQYDQPCVFQCHYQTNLANLNGGTHCSAQQCEIVYRWHLIPTGEWLRHNQSHFGD